MFDIKLNKDGDIDVSGFGDVSLTESIRQIILIRLRWIFNEWRLGPEYGFTWFEDVLVKNPNLDNIKQLIREEIMDVDGVTSATVSDITYSRKDRTAKFKFYFSVSNEQFEEEVLMYV